MGYDFPSLQFSETRGLLLGCFDVAVISFREGNLASAQGQPPATLCSWEGKVDLSLKRRHLCVSSFFFHGITLQGIHYT